MGTKLERDGSRYILRVERRLDESPAKVWRALTTRDLLKRWFPCDVQGEWTVGAALRFEFPEGEAEGLSEEELRGEVLTVDEPRLLEFRWGTEVLRYELMPDGDGCRFRLSHSFEDPAWGARNAAGWEMCIENLDLIVEGVGVAKFVAEVWWTKYRHYKAVFEGEYGTQIGPPEGHPILGEG